MATIYDAIRIQDNLINISSKFSNSFNSIKFNLEAIQKINSLHYEYFPSIQQALVAQQKYLNSLPKSYNSYLQNIDQIFSKLSNICDSPNLDEPVENASELLESFNDLSEYIKDEFTDSIDNELLDNRAIINDRESESPLNWITLAPIIMALCSLLIEISLGIYSINSAKSNEQFQTQVVNVLEQINESLDNSDIKNIQLK